MLSNQKIGTAIGDLALVARALPITRPSLSWWTILRCVITTITCCIKDMIVPAVHSDNINRVSIIWSNHPTGREVVIITRVSTNVAHSGIRTVANKSGVCVTIVTDRVTGTWYRGLNMKTGSGDGTRGEWCYLSAHRVSKGTQGYKTDYQNQREAKVRKVSDKGNVVDKREEHARYHE